MRPRGTDGSNPVPSSGESGANLIFEGGRWGVIDDRDIASVRDGWWRSVYSGGSCSSGRQAIASRLHNHRPPPSVSMPALRLDREALAFGVHPPDVVLS